MNNTQLFIPDKCKVGLQLREGTYTGKLGYIIYHDGKVWRKENSWESWRHKNGQKINICQPTENKPHNWVDVIIEGVDPIEFVNEPTEGFVLNKKAGGYSSGWNHRQTYCRVYDPRGWEFEITIQNLLFILEECNSYKGKGLSGQFIYSWDGKDLVLLPISSQDYKACMEYTKLQDKKITAKDLVEGHTYLTNKQNEYVYIGRYHVYNDNYCDEEMDDRYPIRKVRGKVKKYIFWEDTKYGGDFKYLTTLVTIKGKITDTPHPKFADRLDYWLNETLDSSPAKELIYLPVNKKELDNSIKSYWGQKLYDLNTYISVYVFYDKNSGLYEIKRNFAGDIVDTKTKNEVMKKYGVRVRVYENGLKYRII